MLQLSSTVSPLVRPASQTNEAPPDLNSASATVAVDADQSSELHDDDPF
jgi:hypothetical protein